MPELISAWRNEALENARRLLDAGSPAARERIETAIDANATLRSLLIWRATRYAQARRVRVLGTSTALRRQSEGDGAQRGRQNSGTARSPGSVPLSQHRD